LLNANIVQHKAMILMSGHLTNETHPFTADQAKDRAIGHVYATQLDAGTWAPILENELRMTIALFLNMKISSLQVDIGLTKLWNVMVGEVVAHFMLIEDKIARRANQKVTIYCKIIDN